MPSNRDDPRPNSLLAVGNKTHKLRWESETAEPTPFACPCPHCDEGHTIRSKDVTPDGFHLELWFVDKETDQPRFQLIP